MKTTALTALTNNESDEQQSPTGKTCSSFIRFIPNPNPVSRTPSVLEWQSGAGGVGHSHLFWSPVSRVVATIESLELLPQGFVNKLSRSHRCRVSQQLNPYKNIDRPVAWLCRHDRLRGVCPRLGRHSRTSPPGEKGILETSPHIGNRRNEDTTAITTMGWRSTAFLYLVKIVMHKGFACVV